MHLFLLLQTATSDPEDSGMTQEAFSSVFNRVRPNLVQSEPAKPEDRVRKNRAENSPTILPRFNVARALCHRFFNQVTQGPETHFLYPSASEISGAPSNARERVRPQDKLSTSR